MCYKPGMTLTAEQQAWLALYIKAIDDAAEGFRVKLGLRTWEDQAQHAVSTGATDGRRSGRTCRGLLTAIARCVARGAHVLVIDGYNNANSDYCVAMARDLAAQLGLQIDVRRKGDGRCSVMYIDHWRGDHDLIPPSVR